MTGGAIRKAIAPAYLFLCLLLGGSSQGAWGNALLQILAVSIIAWLALDAKGASLPRSARPLAMILGAALLLVALQLIPFPPAIWTAFPGRGMVAEGRELLGLGPGWSSISLAPYESFTTPFALLPPIALFLAVVRWGRGAESWLAAALITVTFLGILLGLPQVLGGKLATNPWHFYERSNFGYATGFFANKNHMASLLLVALPFIVALGSIAAEATKDARKRYSVTALTTGGIGVLVVGLALNKSMAGLGLLLPVSIASIWMVRRAPPMLRLAVAGFGAAAFIAFLTILFTPLGERLAPAGSSDSLSSRQEILSKSIGAVKEFGPVGSGLGTFEKVYPLFENPDTVGRTYINHAHNDYVELTVELGVAGVILIALFLFWWSASVKNMLAAPNASLFAKAGAIGSAAILLHSAVDYPLRTAGMTSVFALCLAMVLISRTTARSSKDFREARHLVIE